MAYDISMTSLEQVLALINEKNGLAGDAAMTANKLTFGLPAQFTPADGETDEDLLASNTQVDVTGVQNSGVRGGPETLFYKRIPLPAFVAADPGNDAYPEGLLLQVSEEEEDGSVTFESIVEAFNAYYGSALAVEDFDAAATELPAAGALSADGSYVDVTLHANANSLAYTDSIVVRLEGKDVALASVLTTTALGELVFAMPAEQAS